MVGADGYALLAALDAPGAPPEPAGLPVVATLRDVWARHFERPAQPPGDRPPGRGGEPQPGEPPAAAEAARADTQVEVRLRDSRALPRAA